MASATLAVCLLWGCELGGGDDCEGDEGCQCYPNGTCDAPLSCASNLCVAVGGDVAAPGDATRGGGGGAGTGAAGDGSGGSSSASGGGSSGGGGQPMFMAAEPTGDAPAGDCAGGTRATVTGALRTDVADVVFDTVSVTVHHKRDIDMIEDGCLRELTFQLNHGDGCQLEIVARDEIDLQGRLKIVSAEFSADSQCPMFPDDREGVYGGIEPYRFGGVGMQFDSVAEYNVETTCIENTFWLQPVGEMHDAGGRALVLAAGTDLAIGGTFQSTSADGVCPQRDEPIPPPPTAGTGGGSGTAGAGGGTAGTGGGVADGECPEPHMCVENTTFSSALFPRACALQEGGYPITCTSVEDCHAAGFPGSVVCVGQLFAFPEDYCFMGCNL